MTEGINQNEGSWENLPALVIEKVYTYLDRADQMIMSLTCKNWLNEFSQPGLWKNFKFFLQDHSSTIETWPEVKFTKKFGYMIRHVKIIGSDELVSVNVISKAYNQLRLFLEYLKASETQLLSIEFINLYVFCQHLTEEENSGLFQSTLNLISSQNQLQKIAFHKTYFAEEDGVKLLKTVYKNCSNLQKLILTGFIKIKSGDTNPNSIEIYENLALQFLKLEAFMIDYSEIFENIFRPLQDLQYVSKNISKRLSLIVIECDGSQKGNFQEIPSMTWKVLCKICPALEVKLTYSCLSEMRNPVEMYLVKHMPVVELEFELNDLNQTGHIQVEQFIQPIICSKVNEHVRRFCIFWMSQRNNIFIHLLSFLNTCSKIRSFFISLIYPVPLEDVRNFFGSLLNNHPTTLVYLHITVFNVPNDEEQLQLTALADEYTSLFKVIDVDVFLTCNP